MERPAHLLMDNFLVTHSSFHGYAPLIMQLSVGVWTQRSEDVSDAAPNTESPHRHGLVTLPLTMKLKHSIILL